MTNKLNYNLIFAVGFLFYLNGIKIKWRSQVESEAISSAYCDRWVFGPCRMSSIIDRVICEFLLGVVVY